MHTSTSSRRMGGGVKNVHKSAKVCHGALVDAIEFPVEVEAARVKVWQVVVGRQVSASVFLGKQHIHNMARRHPRCTQATNNSKSAGELVSFQQNHVHVRTRAHTCTRAHELAHRVGRAPVSQRHRLRAAKETQQRRQWQTRFRRCSADAHPPSRHRVRVRGGLQRESHLDVRRCQPRPNHTQP